MAGGLVGLFDDVAALAKLAAASVDDVGAAAARASMKAAGVVVDDTAVTPAYVQGLAADRELPIIGRIARGSIRNKVLFILPAAIGLSAVAPDLVEIILICGGAFLCFEGAHKVIHALRRDHHDEDVPVVVQGAEAEEATVRGAIRTDFILSGEIMVIALKEVMDEPILARAAILLVVAIFITAIVYGLVALIVKMDDVGLALTRRGDGASRRLGRGLVAAMPKLLTVLTVVGTAAMLWVGGHIVLAGAAELGWHTPLDVVHDAAHRVPRLGSFTGAAEWAASTLGSAVVGLVLGALIATVVERLGSRAEGAVEAH